jgi:N-acetyl-anhydromuramyl-L-alanine amidase AmpD
MTDNYAPAHWRPSPNFTSQQRTIDCVIIHDSEGLYEPSIVWLTGGTPNASAHYILQSSDGDVTQMVHEADVAWHCGNWSYNVRSVSIEHEGYKNDPARWYTDAMLEASAKLAAALCTKYNIPADRAHIIGHAEVPDPGDPHLFGGVDHHTDPGPGWPWQRYITRIRALLAAPSPQPAPLDWVTPHLVSLEVDGLVVSGELTEYYPTDGNTYTVQYFERAKFEKHADGSVTRARLGIQAYQQQYHNK